MCKALRAEETRLHQHFKRGSRKRKQYSAPCYFNVFFAVEEIEIISKKYVISLAQ